MSFPFLRLLLDKNLTEFYWRSLAYRWPTASACPFQSHSFWPSPPPQIGSLGSAVSIMRRLKIIGSICDLYLFCLAKTFTNEAKFYFWVGAHVSVHLSESLVYLLDIWRALLLSASELFTGKRKKKKRKSFPRWLFLGHGVCSNQHKKRCLGYDATTNITWSLGYFLMVYIDILPLPPPNHRILACWK